MKTIIFIIILSFAATVARSQSNRIIMDALRRKVNFHSGDTIFVWKPTEYILPSMLHRHPIVDFDEFLKRDIQSDWQMHVIKLQPIQEQNGVLIINFIDYNVIQKHGDIQFQHYGSMEFKYTFECSQNKFIFTKQKSIVL